MGHDAKLVMQLGRSAVRVRNFKGLLRPVVEVPTVDPNITLWLYPHSVLPVNSLYLMAYNLNVQCIARRNEVVGGMEPVLLPPFAAKGWYIPPQWSHLAGMGLADRAEQESPAPEVALQVGQVLTGNPEASNGRVVTEENTLLWVTAKPYGNIQYVANVSKTDWL